MGTDEGSVDYSSKQYDGDLLRYQLEHQGRLLNYQLQKEAIHHSDRAAVDIGVFVLKIVMFINAGALIGVLPSVLSLTDQGLRMELVGAGQLFGLGRLGAGFAALLAYIYQSLVTATEIKRLHEISLPDQLAPFQWAWSIARGLIIAVVVLVLAAFSLFATGLLRVLIELGG